MDILARIFGKRFFYGILISVLFVCSLFVLLILLTREPAGVQAQKAYFYPEICLGGFKSAKNASGVPEALGDNDYTEDNSAVYEDGDSAIFCGEFMGELPPQTYQTRVTLRFSWQQVESVVSVEDTSILDAIVDIFVDEESESTDFEDKNPEGEGSDEAAEATVATSTEELTTDIATTSLDAATSTEGVINTEEENTSEAEEVSVEEVTTNTEELEEEPVEESVIEPSEEVEIEASPASEPEPAPEPVSWWWGFVSTVSAEELAEATTTEITALEIEADLAATTEVEEGLIENVSDINEEEPVEVTEVESIFAVEYTLDGEVWHNVGYVNTIDNDVRFELPKEALVSIEDVNEVQIALRPLLSLDNQPEIYLDSMWFEVSYAPVRELGVHALSGLIPEEFALADFLNTDGPIKASTTILGMSPEQFVASTTFIHGIDNRYVMAGVYIDDVTELWLIDMDLKKVKRIGFAEAAIGAYPLGAKERMLFWLNYDASIIFTYDLRTGGSLHEMALVGNLPEGEERRFTFPFTDWQVVWRADEFYFFKDSPGEVFKDENAKAVERFNTYLASVAEARLSQEVVASTTEAIQANTVEVEEEAIASTTENQNGDI